MQPYNSGRSVVQGGGRSRVGSRTRLTPRSPQQLTLSVHEATHGLECAARPPVCGENNGIDGSALFVGVKPSLHLEPEQVLGGL